MFGWIVPTSCLIYFSSSSNSEALLYLFLIITSCCYIPCFYTHLLFFLGQSHIYSIKVTLSFIVSSLVSSVSLPLQNWPVKPALFFFTHFTCHFYTFSLPTSMGVLLFYFYIMACRAWGVIFFHVWFLGFSHVYVIHMIYVYLNSCACTENLKREADHMIKCISLTLRFFCNSHTLIWLSGFS